MKIIGDKSEFAIEYEIYEDQEPSNYTDDLNILYSWGWISIYVKGKNTCEFIPIDTEDFFDSAKEDFTKIHWYLYPLAEWFSNFRERDREYGEKYKRYYNSAEIINQYWLDSFAICKYVDSPRAYAAHTSRMNKISIWRDFHGIRSGGASYGGCFPNLYFRLIPRFFLLQDKIQVDWFEDRGDPETQGFRFVESEGIYTFKEKIVLNVFDEFSNSVFEDVKRIREWKKK